MNVAFSYLLWGSLSHCLFLGEGYVCVCVVVLGGGGGVCVKFLIKNKKKALPWHAVAE